MVLRTSVITALLLGFASLQTSSPTPSQSAPAKAPGASHAAQNAGHPDESANALVKTTVQNELNAIANDHTHWMYLSQTRKDGAMVTEQVVETPHGNIE